jgi:hypothetical protein
LVIHHGFIAATPGFSPNYEEVGKNIIGKDGLKNLL